eukprot:5699334-Prymnesium_polylepis.1
MRATRNPTPRRGPPTACARPVAQRPRRHVLQHQGQVLARRVRRLPQGWPAGLPQPLHLRLHERRIDGQPRRAQARGGGLRRL